MNHQDFLSIIQATWDIQVQPTNIVPRIAVKFKNLRRTMKRWSKEQRKLTNVIKNCNEDLLILDKLE
jgi:hypothetical protein